MNGSTSIRIKGTACVGWIPFYDSVEASGSRTFLRYSERDSQSRLLCAVLFSSGNPQPADNIASSIETFREFLALKEYRGAISLHNIELTRHKNGTVDVNVDPLESDEQVGFTPYRVPGLPRGWVFWRGRGRQPDQDGKQNAPSVEVANDGSVSISHEVRFKIGKIGDLASFLLTGYWAPYARVRISYRISASNLCSVQVFASGIPSQTVYLDWSRLHFCDMLSISETELIGFLQSGRGLAPLVFSFTHSWQE